VQAERRRRAVRRARLDLEGTTRPVATFHKHVNYWLLPGQELPRHLLNEDALVVEEFVEARGRGV
jgi:hypothetical protein